MLAIHFFNTLILANFPWLGEIYMTLIESCGFYILFDKTHINFNQL